MAEKRTLRKVGLVEHRGTYHHDCGQFEIVRDFKCRQDDIWVCSFPRSGTTLTQQTVYLVQTLDFEKAFSTPLLERFPIIEFYIEDDPLFRGPKYLDEMTESEPRMIKSHLHHFLLPEDLKRGKGKIIYIVRNPKSVIPSLYKLLKLIKRQPTDTMREYLELFLTQKDLYACPWGLHVREYWEHRNDENVLFLQFENVIKDRHGTIRRIAEFLGKQLSDTDVDRIVDYTSLESMKTNKSVDFTSEYNTNEGFGQFVNKGEVSGWRKDIPEDLVTKFDELIEREIGSTDIKFM